MKPTITCKDCGAKISIDEMLLHEIKEEALREVGKDHQQKLKELEAKITRDNEVRLAEQVAEARDQATESASKKAELQIKTFEENVAEAKKDNAELRQQLKEIMQQLREANKARDNAELKMQKKLAEEEAKIRADAAKTAEEKYQLKNDELKKQLADTQKALEDANRKAAQGSQQNQGEVLELQLEGRLREEFPLDDISEVKKGQRGADIVQTVKNQSLAACGVLLWETKNGKWQPAWTPKFRQDIRAAGAGIGVIVSQEMPPQYGDMKQLGANLWVVKPRLAPVLAAALRTTILQVDAANKNNVNKDAKLEALYQFLVGSEFRHRIEAIVENYGQLQEEIEREKRATALRWSRQEKSIRAVIDNTIGMYGDLQGITNRALPGIKSLELEAKDVEDESINNNKEL